MKQYISTLVEGGFLSRQDAYDAMMQIMSGDATPAQIASYLTALRLRVESADVIAGSVEAMRANFTSVAVPSGRIVDTCGTGGDGRNTFNISTASAIIAAAAGATLAKHGNRSVSSQSGSADVLKALGVNIEASPEIMETCLKEAGIAFLFAPSLHPAMKHAIGPRRELGIRTLFNILGPLSNPAGAQYGVLGVFAKERVKPLAEAALQTGAKHLYVVHGSDGLDEITLTGPSFICEVMEGEIKEYDFSPETLGLTLCSPDDLKGGSPEDNAEIILDLLNGKPGAPLDICLLNASAAITASGISTDLQAGLEAAREAVASGKAKSTLDKLARLSQSS